ncbi:CaiB/BaiF CoA transferase family protein [Jiangella asiatica]|uniref:CoA transferase n=1 Tax=Jiangella asiatica TaxID=2530372 RepID=A0A4R5CN31_9ACTN|nr:CoA transferase [Jiangella asiatica]TDE00670.1 CoA transferase [Jiangella asiatica]
MEPETPAPLAGLRVLDFAWIGAGALVTKALAELGAEVIRIESRVRPDNLRQSPPFRPGTTGLDASGYFASRNPGKKSVALNMKHPRAREIALALAARSDVFTSNFRTGVLERWRMTYADVRTVNPRVVFLAMPMQGSDGPHRDYVGFGSTIAALAGLVHTTAVPGRPPVGTGTHYPDHVPNPGHALVALLAAIYHQQRTGEGQYVELSQLESTVNVVGHGVVHSSLGGDVEPAGNRSPGTAPRGAYRCADGEWIALACHTDEHWQALASVLDRPGWLTDDRFSTVLERIGHADELDELLRVALESRRRPAVVDALTAAGVPAGPVNSAKDMLADPHLTARGFWQPVNHAVIGEIPMSHLPFRLGDGPRPEMTPPPLLGEHTREVATGLLELTDEQYDDLVRDGVFR